MKRRNARPWGRLLGLLCGCIVTLVGVVFNLDPLVVLQRAVIAGVSMGILGAVFAAVLNQLTFRRGTR